MKKHKRLLLILSVIITLFIILSIPYPTYKPIYPAKNKPYKWDTTNPIDYYKCYYQQIKHYNQNQLQVLLQKNTKTLNKYINQLKNQSIEPNDSIWNNLLFHYAQLISTATLINQSINEPIYFLNQIRTNIKQQSIQWDKSSINTHNTLYKINYGIRSLYDELIFNKTDKYPCLHQIQKSNSPTPSFNMLGMTIHSGDILISKGGAEVSALISRSTDYPGNFSHIALAYIDPKTNTPYLLESHIEVGVTKSSVEQYLKDEKLRIMVVRPNSNLKPFITKPYLGHYAAKIIYNRKCKEHIPYDFKMDLNESQKLFCSEVASHAYQTQGIQLWQIPSTISRKGCINWLQSFGVQYYTTQMPSDLEYDSQLNIIYEWRNHQALLKDRIYNAAIDALLIRADQGEELKYNALLLPYARILKAICSVLNQFDVHWIIPQGMQPIEALKSRNFISKHKQIRNKLLIKYKAHRSKNKEIITYNDFLTWANE